MIKTPNLGQRSFLFLVRPARLERAACGFEVRRSIRLSYGRTQSHHTKKWFQIQENQWGRKN